MRGLSAYTVACAIALHFMRKGYDGWKYNFKTKVAEKRFNAHKQTQFVYAAVEKRYPQLLDQIKYLYPYFKRYGAFANKLNIRLVDAEYKKFIDHISMFDEQYVGELLKTLKLNLSSITELFDQHELLPKVYQLYDRKVITHDQAVLLFMIFPDLNSTSSNEPYVYDAWKSDITFDKQFVSLYIHSQSLIAMQVVAKDSI